MVERKEGDEHMIWNIESWKMSENGKNGMVGVLRKAKISSMTMNPRGGDLKEKLMRTSLPVDKKAD